MSLVQRLTQRFAGFLLIFRVFLSASSATDLSIIDTTESFVSNPVIATIETPNTSRTCSDRVWVISTRHLTNEVCFANLDRPDFRVHELVGPQYEQLLSSSLDEFVTRPSEGRTTVYYVHGNRLTSSDAIARGLDVYRKIISFRCQPSPVDWVMFSWPSEKDGILTHDAREKADRTDAQGLYLAKLLRSQTEPELTAGLIGYSFGARIISGALHATAGGALAGRALPDEPLRGAAFNVGMIAPAIESNWMAQSGYHQLATQNMNRLILLYNQRDAVLKRYWRLNRIRGSMALGYSGPQQFASRFDGSSLPVRSRDCSPSVGIKHDELDYYNQSCSAGRELALFVSGSINP
jgi:hypothetical protein